MHSAFLQGREQDRKLWAKLPSEALALLGVDEDTRMLLLKPCYGQIDAPRGWYLEAVDRLRRGGLRQHALDPCAFLIYETDDDNYNEHDPVHQQVNSLGSERLAGMVIMTTSWEPDARTALAMLQWLNSSRRTSPSGSGKKILKLWSIVVVSCSALLKVEENCTNLRQIL